MSDTPRTDAVLELSDPGELARFCRQLERTIRENNAQVEADCLQWTCRERDDGERCPNCPMVYWIKL